MCAKKTAAANAPMRACSNPTQAGAYPHCSWYYHAHEHNFTAVGAPMQRALFYCSPTPPARLQPCTQCIVQATKQGVQQEACRHSLRQAPSHTCRQGCTPSSWAACGQIEEKQLSKKCLHLFAKGETELCTRLLTRRGQQAQTAAETAWVKRS